MKHRTSGRSALVSVIGILSVALLLGACGSGGATPTPTPTARAKTSPTSAAGGSIRPIDGGAPSAPATPSTPAPVPAAVTDAFPGLPLDKVAAMNYSPDEKRLVLVTHLGAGDTAGGQAVCNAFLGVALFDPNATIAVVATDYSPLATCRK